MGDTITSINHSAGHITVAETDCLRAVAILADLSVKGKRCLHTNEKTLDVEGLKHDLGNLLTILGSVHGGFSQNKPVLFGFATQVLMD